MAQLLSTLSSYWLTRIIGGGAMLGVPPHLAVGGRVHARSRLQARLVLLLWLFIYLRDETFATT